MLLTDRRMDGQWSDDRRKRQTGNRTNKQPNRLIKTSVHINCIWIKFLGTTKILSSKHCFHLSQFYANIIISKCEINTVNDKDIRLGVISNLWQANTLARVISMEISSVYTRFLLWYRHHHGIILTLTLSHLRYKYSDEDGEWMSPRPSALSFAHIFTRLYLFISYYFRYLNSIDVI